MDEFREFRGSHGPVALRLSSVVAVVQVRPETAERLGRDPGVYVKLAGGHSIHFSDAGIYGPIRAWVMGEAA